MIKPIQTTGRLICPEGRVSSLNKSNPIQSIQTIYRSAVLPWCEISAVGTVQGDGESARWWHTAPQGCIVGKPLQHTSEINISQHFTRFR